jgi:hypothetical protein
MHVLANKKILQIIHEFLGANAHLSTTHSNAIKPCNVKKCILFQHVSEQYSYRQALWALGISLHQPMS